MRSSIRLFAVSLLALALAACASGQQKPPACKGKYEQVNAPHHYLLTGASL
jgi:hypothetical protein